MLPRVAFSLNLIFCLGLMGCQSATMESQLFEPPPPLINFALLSKGATAEASESVPNHLPEEVIDGDTSSETWDEGSGWGCALSHLRTSDLNKRPYVQVNLPEPVDIRRVVVYTIDSQQHPAPQYSLKDYRVEYWHGTGWGLIPTGDTKNRQYTAKDNTKGKRVHEITGRLTAQQIRLVPVSTNDTVRNYQHMGNRRPVYDVEGVARVMELEVWGYPVASSETAQKLIQAIAPQAQMEPTEEELIKEVLRRYQEGYEAANLEQVVSCVSANYNSNGRTSADVEARAAALFENHHDIQMTLSDIDIYQNVIDGTAVVTGTYTLQYTPNDSDRAKQTAGNLSIVLAHEDDGWRIIRAD